jgi:hypothetical protein
VSEATSLHFVPSPDDQAAQVDFTAEEFIRQLRARGARVYRMRVHGVFCLTNDPETAAWLHQLGAVPYLPRNAERTVGEGPLGSYRRAKGGALEWDFYIHTVPVVGEQTVWEAAGKQVPTVEATDFA